MFIELLPYYSYLLFLLSIALLGFSAGVFCSSRGKCQGTPYYDLAPLRCTQQRTQQAVQRRTPTPDRIGKSEAAACSKTSKNLGSRGLPTRTAVSSCKLRDPDQLMMSTSTGKVDEKREELNTSCEAKINMDMEKREEWGKMQKELDNTGKVQDMEKREKGKELRREQDSNPRRMGLRSLSVGKRGGGKESNLGSKTLNFAVAEESKKAEGGRAGVERKGSLTGEEVKELADAFIARVRQRMRVQRQESLASRQASYEARLHRSS